MFHNIAMIMRLLLQIMSFKKHLQQQRKYVKTSPDRAGFMYENPYWSIEYATTYYRFQTL